MAPHWLTEKLGRFFTFLTVGFSLGAITGSAVWAADDILRPHRAVYDVVLDKASDRSGIRAMDGRIVYEMKGSRCEGYAVRFRILMRVQSTRRSFTSDQRNTSFESGDGKTFNFSNQSFLNDQMEMSIQGVATRTEDGLDVQFSKPAATQIQLDDAVFLTEHVERLIKGAKNDENIVTTRIYDAGEKGLELTDTTAIIGKRQTSVVVKDETPQMNARFEGKDAWSMSISYFAIKQSAVRGERLPDYQASFIMQEDGVTRRLKMTYPDYTLRAKLSNLEYFETAPCD